MHPRNLVIWALCLVSSLFAQQAPSPAPSTESAQIWKQLEAIPLNVARNGGEIIVSWTTPTVGVRSFEIFRNENEGMRGRLRIALVRADREAIFDTLPDPAGKYWYWIKAASYDGQVINIGPVPAPTGKVWTP